MSFNWKPEYDDLAKQFLAMYFGNTQGLTSRFPCMRDDYPWGKHRPDVVDSRVTAKNNTEYHGLERYACQYYATAQYEEAYHHWLLAAFWRREDIKANNFNDKDHRDAVRYAIKQALYNKALHEWQKSIIKILPEPKNYGLSAKDLDQKEIIALEQIKTYQSTSNDK